MPKVAITCSLVANGGDAAILLGTLRVLENAFGEVQATVYDLLPEVARHHYPELEVRDAPFRYTQRRPTGPRRLGRIRDWVENTYLLRRWSVACSRLRAGKPLQARAIVGREAFQILEEYASHDLTVASGGTYLVENYDIRPHFVDLSLAAQLGVPQALLTQSLGPFDDPANQHAIRRLIRETGLTVLRDERSRRHLQDIGADGPSVHVGADTAFALADLNTLESARRYTWPTDRAPRIGISVRRWPYFETESATSGMDRYGEAVRALTNYVVQEMGAEVVFVSTCQGNPEYGYDDSKLAAEWRAQLPPETQASVTVDPDYHRPDELMTILGSFDLVVSTRMHVAILSLCSGTPVLPISYEFKTEELFGKLGVPDWVSDIENVVPASLIAQFDRVLADLPARRSSLFDAVTKMRASALEASDLLRDTFEEIALT